jgi:hypothetical protein
MSMEFFQLKGPAVRGLSIQASPAPAEPVVQPKEKPAKPAPTPTPAKPEKPVEPVLPPAPSPIQPDPVPIKEPTPRRRPTLPRVCPLGPSR